MRLVCFLRLALYFVGPDEDALPDTDWAWVGSTTGTAWVGKTDGTIWAWGLGNDSNTPVIHPQLISDFAEFYQAAP